MEIICEQLPGRQFFFFSVKFSSLVVILDTKTDLNLKILTFLDPNRPVWEFKFENVDGDYNLNNTGVDPSSLSLKLNEGKLVHHPSRRGKVLYCDNKKFCVDTIFDPDSETGKCMKYDIRIRWSCRSSHQRCSRKKGVLKNFAILTGKHLWQTLFFNKVAGITPANLLKEKLCQRCFPVNFAKFLRTHFLQNTTGRLLLELFMTIRQRTYSQNIWKNFKVCREILLSNFAPTQLTSLLIKGFVKNIARFF